MRNRELRLLRREWRRTIRDAGRCNREGYPDLSALKYRRADMLEQKIAELTRKDVF